MIERRSDKAPPPVHLSATNIISSYYEKVPWPWKELVAQLAIVFCIEEISSKGDQTIKRRLVSLLSDQKAIGPFRESNPGPPAPKAGIIPLDQMDTVSMFHFYNICQIVLFVSQTSETWDATNSNANQTSAIHPATTQTTTTPAKQTESEGCYWRKQGARIPSAYSFPYYCKDLLQARCHRTSYIRHRRSFILRRPKQGVACTGTSSSTVKNYYSYMPGYA